MNRNELLQTAIDSLSAAGALLNAGDPVKGKEMAEKAWNAYYELQRNRLDDEDFTDLIYAARNLYEKCDSAIAAQANKGDDKEKQLSDALIDKQLGEFGDVNAALRAEEWFTNDENWPFLADKGLIDANFISSWVPVLQNIIFNEKATVNQRAFAAYRLGILQKLPKYWMVNMAAAAQCFSYAANLLLNSDDANEQLLINTLDLAVECYTLSGDIPKAGECAKVAMSKGADMSIMLPIAEYGYRHDEKTAPELADAMIEAGCWEGMLAKGQHLLTTFLDDENEETGELLAEVINQMAKYYDENPESIGGYACLAFIAYRYLFIEELDLLESDWMDTIREGIGKHNMWCYAYYGQILQLCSNAIEDPDKAKEMLAQAKYCLNVAADDGLRLGLQFFYDLLRVTDADPGILKSYENAAKQYDIN